MIAIDGKHCLWCGRTLDRAHSPGQLYCSAGHRTKQREHRAKLVKRPLVSCPTPAKTPYPHRGTAFRAAATYRQFTYLCSCGVYHLTSKPPRRRRRGRVRRTAARPACNTYTDREMTAPHHGCGRGSPHAA